MINRVFDEDKAALCDVLLIKLIQDEKKYNLNLDENFVVKDYFKKVIKNENNILLSYEVNNEIIAYIFLKQIICDENKGYLIDGLYVEDNYRNNGIAKVLITEALNIIKEKKVSFIDINVMYDNVIARKVYKYFGFNEFKIQLRKVIEA
ncbi:MAG: GNAT family N-acetyltransferase [Bacilli bacterium]